MKSAYLFTILLLTQGCDYNIEKSLTFMGDISTEVAEKTGLAGLERQQSQVRIAKVFLGEKYSTKCVNLNKEDDAEIRELREIIINEYGKTLKSKYTKFENSTDCSAENVSNIMESEYDFIREGNALELSYISTQHTFYTPNDSGVKEWEYPTTEWLSQTQCENVQNFECGDSSAKDITLKNGKIIFQGMEFEVN